MRSADRLLAIWKEAGSSSEMPASAFSGMPSTSATRARKALGVVSRRSDEDGYVWDFSALEPEKPEPTDEELAEANAEAARQNRDRDVYSQGVAIGLPVANFGWISRYGKPSPDDPRWRTDSWIRDPAGRWWPTRFGE